MENLIGHKMETVDTAKGIPTVTRHSLTLQRNVRIRKSFITVCSLHFYKLHQKTHCRLKSGLVTLPFIGAYLKR
jgi:hypothetical protein